MLGSRPNEYVDILKPGALARLGEDATDADKLLPQRKTLLMPSSCGVADVCEVASFLCIARNTADFLDVVARAGERSMSLLALDTGRQITAGPGVIELAREIPFFQAAMRGRVALRNRDEFNRAREAEANARAQKVKPRWHLPNSEAPWAALMIEAGKDGVPMSRATLEKHLGNRLKAQRAYQMEQNREAGRRAGATPRRKPKG
jgi:hypothetical protein